MAEGISGETPTDAELVPSYPQLEPWQFKPGQSGNPSGRPKDPPEVKLIKRLTRQEMAEVGSLIVQGKISDLQMVATGPQSTVLKAMIAKVAINIMAKGDMHSLDLLLNRLIGKVKDEVVVDNLNTQVQRVVVLPSNGREVDGGA